MAATAAATLEPRTGTARAGVAPLLNQKDRTTMDLISLAIAVAFFAAMVVVIDLLERV